MTCPNGAGDWKDKTMNLEGKRVLVVGSGKSGVAAAELLRKKGITFVLFDGNKDLDVTALIEKNPVFAGAEILLGELAPEDMARIDLVVLSPGVPTDLPMVNELRNRQIPIWGEIELAYHFAKGRIIAITGTNGKTTTTSLVGEIMANYFDDVKVVGNIGIPYTSVAANTTEDTVTVAEISSFQLETTHEFAPEVTAILNITPDHLNRHHTMEAYIEAKENIAKNQTEKDTCVLNYEDDVTRAFGENIKSKVINFISPQTLEEGIYLENGQIVLAMNGEKTPVCHVDELNILGTHNHENAMAAAGMAAAGKFDKKDYRVYTLCGDGEIQEGQIWEAAMWAGFKKLDNLVVVVDNNNLQIDGAVDEVCSPYPIDKKFEAFNFHVINIDGNDFDQIRAAFKEARETKGMPTAIIAKTVKGKGVSFMENVCDWHGKAPNDEQYEVAMADLEKVGEALCQK